MPPIEELTPAEVEQLRKLFGDDKQKKKLKLALTRFPLLYPGSFSNDFGAPRKGHTHQGNDIFAPKGTPVVAVQDGKIVRVTRDKTAGLLVWLKDKEGNVYRYYHLDSIPGEPADYVGKQVKAGQVIAFVGTTGNAEGGKPHLHFEVHSPTAGRQNPYSFLVATKGGRAGGALPTTLRTEILKDKGWTPSELEGQILAYQQSLFVATGGKQRGNKDDALWAISQGYSSEEYAKVMTGAFPISAKEETLREQVKQQRGWTEQQLQTEVLSMQSALYKRTGKSGDEGTALLALSSGQTIDNYPDWYNQYFPAQLITPEDEQVFRATIESLFEEHLGHAPAEDQINFYRAMWRDREWKASDFEAHIASSAEAKFRKHSLAAEKATLERQEKLKGIHAEIDNLYVQLGIKPSPEMETFGVQTFEGGATYQEAYRKFQELLAQSPEYKKRYPGMPQGWTADRYDDFRRQANSTFLSTRGRTPRDDEIEMMLAGNPVPADVGTIGGQA